MLENDANTIRDQFLVTGCSRTPIFDFAVLITDILPPDSRSDRKSYKFKNQNQNKLSPLFAIHFSTCRQRHFDQQIQFHGHIYAPSVLSNAHKNPIKLLPTMKVNAFETTATSKFS